MYVTTFYSFKGGVGRTMALANVAVDLARRGKRVLVVDFDLEAPGLDTFDLPRPDDSRLGVVDFVQHYLQSNQAPDASTYLYESPGVGQDGGGLWIMPSGAPGESYSKRLSGIDWADLYERHDGYLLFEDLKLQWEHCVKPEYVFIDSRTGHTDVGGICTRQLPDAVVVLFFPNEQNLRGLTKVVRDIRAEETGQRAKAIKLHFVMSNVPDIDDEDQILANILQSFRERLELKNDPIVIHRYQSLSLLNQAIFTVTRPNSRLAREYRNLLEAIMRNNPQDRNSVFQYISSLRDGFDRSPSDNLNDDAANYLNEIERNNRNDGQVLYRLGKFMEYVGNFDECMRLLGRSIEAGYFGPEAHISRMDLLLVQFNDKVWAAKEALMVLEFPNLQFDQVLHATTTLALSPKHSESILDCQAIRSLPPDDQIRLAKRLNGSVTEAQISNRILLSVLSTPGISSQHERLANGALVFPAMALGRYSNVVSIITALDPKVDERSCEHAFSLGMAIWAITDSIAPEHFRQSLKSHRKRDQNDLTPDTAQLLAIAHWAVGQFEEANGLIDSIAQEWSEAWSKQFSYWRYLRVSASEFRQDIEDLVGLIHGDRSVRPQFMSGIGELSTGVGDSTDSEDV